MIKIVKYCGVWGGWGALGVERQNLTKDNGAPVPPPSVIKIVKYCDVGRGGGIGGAKILQSIMVPPLPVIKIFTSKYGGVWGGGGVRQNHTKGVTMTLLLYARSRFRSK